MKDMQNVKLNISSVKIKEVKISLDKDFLLETSAVDIFSCYTPNFIELKSELVKFLNAEELDRSERFHKEIDRNQFVIYRSILKIILSAYTQLEAKKICFDYQLNKKPYLASHPWLNFNISHSGDYAVIAISRIKVGIDIEYMAEDQDYTNLLIDIFSPKEILNIKNAVDQKKAFYTSWTRKEAFVKALGKGIDDDFIQVPCLDGNHTIDVSLLKNNKSWQIYSFNLAEDYSSAVCIEGLTSNSKNLIMYNVPNNMKELLELSQIRNN